MCRGFALCALVACSCSACVCVCGSCGAARASALSPREALVAQLVLISESCHLIACGSFQAFSMSGQRHVGNIAFASATPHTISRCLLMECACVCVYVSGKSQASADGRRPYLARQSVERRVVSRVCWGERRACAAQVQVQPHTASADHLQNFRCGRVGRLPDNSIQGVPLQTSACACVSHVSFAHSDVFAIARAHVMGLYGHRIAVSQMECVQEAGAVRLCYCIMRHTVRFIIVNMHGLASD